MPRSRLAPDLFDLPADQIASGYYSDQYFVRTRDILRADRHDPVVMMQVFARAHAWLGGIDETIAVLKRCSGGWDDLRVQALYDGDPIAPWETVLTIEGRYSAFVHLETVYLGLLARRTRVLTNTRRVVDAAAPKQVLYFPARHDHFDMQSGDGYAAHLAGAAGVSTDAQGAWWGGQGLGTVPHGLIAAYGGDTVLASTKFVEHVPDTRLVSLVDYDNDCVGTSLAVADALGERLFGVRLDTSRTLVDQSLVDRMGNFDPRGVNPTLVETVRAALDAHGHQHVQIVVSGGMTEDRIRAFEAAGVPCDAYGVGSSLLGGQGGFDFTGDIVRVDGRPCAKVGRAHQPNERLATVT